jgi:hypothetical protein
MKESGIEHTMIQSKSIPGDVSTWMFYVMILLVVSMPLSEFGMSVSQFLLLGLWAYEGAGFKPATGNISMRLTNHVKTLGNNIACKFRRVGSNYVLLVFLSVYFIHVIGILYTSDFNYALKDLRVKLPLLSLPILFATSSAIGFKRFKYLLLFFCAAVIAGSVVSVYVMLTQNISDPREMSVFISHIRFGLLICMAIFILLNFLLRRIYNSYLINAAILISLVWLIAFLFLLKSLTGIIITGIIVIALLFVFILRHKVYSVPALIILFAIIAGTWLYVSNVYKQITVAQSINYSKIDKYTPAGNVYVHDTLTYGIEYGSHVGMYLSVSELRDSWNRRSKLDYDGTDHKGQQLSYTLIRYLHSKGLRKDAASVNTLTEGDIQSIENGVANANYLNNFDLRARVEQILLGYRSYKHQNNPNASSAMQRIEYWKTAFYLIKSKPVFGHGTGDMKDVFHEAYIATNSNLEQQYRHRSHNQFLAITVAFGVVGLLIFLFALFYPPLVLGKFNNYYFFVFFIIAIISFLSEDTLETQAGVTFFAFFNSLLLFSVRKEVDEKSTLSSINI